ncbi:MAG: patatin-like phospholipase family protein, partial [Thermoanaerobaculia bacterium]|nr:patatin-like phospholipase family protein [Thermoanaerobaculia bacterium]
MGPRPRSKVVLAQLLTLTFVLSSPGWAQPAPSAPSEVSATEASQRPVGADRPRIGLALSGGGARGLAHVGVLQALESLNIPIDYIAGTSMGAVVGGMYALGMSPDEIEAELTAVNWTDMFRGSAARKDLSFRRKEDERKFLYGAEIGFTADGIRTPSGTIPSVSLDFFLDSLSLRYGPTGSFDDLSVPFRAVATDIRSGTVVILDHGELSTAIRASMAVPGVLAPVQIGPYSLVDGGVLDNLPVEVVKSMGADVVIAVDVASPLL